METRVSPLSNLCLKRLLVPKTLDYCRMIISAAGNCSKILRTLLTNSTSILQIRLSGILSGGL
jgi:hypothetical protein